ncbi:MAG TPA: hypothetical protein VG938_03845 [Verrucomicrobiae bacterium]|jgi:hypothetical protein|nr:hypothetical protein [Verrucomicrobiae bacterium]
MATESDSPFDQLLKEYSLVFREFDDLTLARWLAQTLGQLEGKAWRSTHPLLGAYRLAAQIGHERQIWFKRLATPPAGYLESPCCRAPMLPLLTRDVRETGLICQHCSDTLVPFEEIPEAVRGDLDHWALQYAPVHAVAHWDDRQRKGAGNYDRAFEQAAREAEALLIRAGSQLAPKFLEFYPAIIWEDQDECLEVRPEDILI